MDYHFIVKFDDFAKSPLSSLLKKFRHCGVPVSTPHSSTFSRLDLELFAKSSVQMTFCESIIVGYGALTMPSMQQCMNRYDLMRF